MNSSERKCGGCNGTPHECKWLPPNAVRWSKDKWADSNGNPVLTPPCDKKESK